MTKYEISCIRVNLSLWIYKFGWDWNEEETSSSLIRKRETKREYEEILMLMQNKPNGNEDNEKAWKINWIKNNNKTRVGKSLKLWNSRRQTLTDYASRQFSRAKKSWGLFECKLSVLSGGRRWLRVFCQTSTGDNILSPQLLRGVRQRSSRAHNRRRTSVHVQSNDWHTWNWTPREVTQLFYFTDTEIQLNGTPNTYANILRISS